MIRHPGIIGGVGGPGLAEFVESVDIGEHRGVEHAGYQEMDAGRRHGRVEDGFKQARGAEISSRGEHEGPGGIDHQRGGGGGSGGETAYGDMQSFVLHCFPIAAVSDGRGHHHHENGDFQHQRPEEDIVKPRGEHGEEADQEDDDSDAQDAVELHHAREELDVAQGEAVVEGAVLPVTYPFAGESEDKPSSGHEGEEHMDQDDQGHDEGIACERENYLLHTLISLACQK